MSKLVGILNLTPDSFSDGGVHVAEDALRLVAEGAAVLDVGAESTRPGASAVTAEEEWARLQPFFAQGLPDGVEISIDTRHASTARQAIARGVHWINDVGGLRDAAMVEAVRDASCRLVLMHSLTVPADVNVTLPPDVDPVEAVLAFFRERLEDLQGIARERFVLDPGLGFGKSAEQSWEVVRRVGELKALGLPLLIGHSRKSFLGGAMAERDARTLEVSRSLAAAGVDYLRVHNLRLHREAL